MELTHRSMVALTPADVPGAQTQLAEWCRRKVAVLGAELREQRANLRQAKAAKWRHSGWERMVNKTKARMIYYTKIRAASLAGYLIVPNFDVEVMAVRVNRARPPAKSEDSTSQYSTEPSTSLIRAKPDLLPPGAGRYVDDVMFHQHEQWLDQNSKGEKITRHRYTVSGYDEPDFPVLAVKPVVLDATRRAMALNIFDRIGVVTGRKKDPVVIGEIIDPSQNHQFNPKRVSFFIAWWLNTQDL